MKNIKIKMKGIIFVALALLLLVFVSSNVFAIGITPGRVTLGFEPGAEKTINFNIVNTEHKEMKVELSVAGDWAESVTLEQRELYFAKQDESKTLSYKIRFPQEGGLDGVKVMIIAKEAVTLNNNGGTGVGATVGVGQQLYIITGETLQNFTDNIEVIRIFVQNYHREGVANVEIEIFNPKNNVMEDVYSVLSIYDKSGSLRSEFNSTVTDIAPREKATVEAFWDTVGFETGNYSGTLITHYDNKTDEQELRIMLSEESIIMEFGEFEAATEEQQPIVVIIKEVSKLEPTPTTIVIGSLVLVVLLLFILWLVLYLRSKRARKMRKK